MSFVDDPSIIADGLVGLGTLVAAGWVASKAFRDWRRLPDPGRNRHALAPFGAAIDPFRAGDDPAFAILRPEQVAAVQRQSGFNLAINIANAIVLVAAVGHTANTAVLVVWFCTVVSIVTMAIARWMRNRRRPPPATVSKRSLRRMTYYAAILGSLWGVGFALFYGSADGIGRIVLAALGMGMAAGGTIALAASLGAAAAFAASVLVPGIVRLLTTGNSGDLTLALLCALYACSMGATLTEVYDFFARNVLAHAAQREQAETIALLLNTYEEHASGWLWRADGDGVMLGSPTRMEELLAVPPGGLAGRPLWSPAGAEPADDVGWSELIEEFRAGRAFRDRVVAVRRSSDGETIWLSLSGRRFAGGTWHGVGSDVTARETALHSLRDAMTAASAGIQAKSLFLATMSHELRTPLNAIIGFTELMQHGVGGMLTAKHREYLSDIHRSGIFLLSLVNDTLDLSKIDAGRLELVEETLEIPSLVSEAVRFVSLQAAASGIAVDVTIDPDLPQVRVDARRIKQVLVNLLSNAVKFTPPQGKIEIRGTIREDGALALVVADSGIGMAVADIPKALERFGQIDDRLERRYEGTGLGLPLASKLIELHGGTLKIDSRIGAGTRVTIVLPPWRIVGRSGETPFVSPPAAPAVGGTVE
ncbi:MAG TPA: HAMP domain-containing sensor histidine kinase [Stellaceae bacterium]|nr:HAMP domain-containing sensor histidine kinase [Stellaceae bacterium]